MEKYVYSGQLTDNMHDMLLATKGFEPIDILTTQLDRDGITKAIKWKNESVDSGDIDPETDSPIKKRLCRWIMVDSGAFSVHTGNAHTTLEEYAEYINSIADDVDCFAQLDRIPGEFGKPKKAEDYEISANESWEAFLKLRSMVKCPEKILPVSHFGEDTKYLKRMLEWKDENGKLLDYIGLSPANDQSKEDRMIYLQNMFDVIKQSSNPNVKTHIFGFTAMDSLAAFPCYSADSISHRLWGAYNKVLSKNFGLIFMSKRPRTWRQKSKLSFIETADEYNLNKLKEEIYEYGITPEFAKKFCKSDRSKYMEGFDENNIFDWMSEDNAIRTVFSIRSIQTLTATKYAYHPNNRTRSKKLFQI